MISSGAPGSVFNPRAFLRRFTKVYGRVDAHRSGWNFTVAWTFRASAGNAERNSALLLLALKELDCPFVVTTHMSPPHQKVIKRTDANGKPRTRTVRSVRVSIAGGITAAAWVKRAMHGPCGNEKKDRLLRQAVIRAKQIDAIILQQAAAFVPQSDPIVYLRPSPAVNLDLDRQNSGSAASTFSVSES